MVKMLSAILGCIIGGFVIVIAFGILNQRRLDKDAKLGARTRKRVLDFLKGTGSVVSRDGKSISGGIITTEFDDLDQAVFSTVDIMCVEIQSRMPLVRPATPYHYEINSTEETDESDPITNS